MPSQLLLDFHAITRAFQAGSSHSPATVLTLPLISTGVAIKSTEYDGEAVARVGIPKKSEGDLNED
jgi:hypothetical protein